MIFQVEQGLQSEQATLGAHCSELPSPKYSSPAHQTESGQADSGIRGSVPLVAVSTAGLQNLVDRRCPTRDPPRRRCVHGEEEVQDLKAAGS